MQHGGVAETKGEYQHFHSQKEQACLFFCLFVCLFAVWWSPDTDLTLHFNISTKPKGRKIIKITPLFNLCQVSTTQKKKEKEFPLLYSFFLTSHQPKEKTSTPFVYSVSDPNKLQHKRKNTQLHCLLLFHRSPTTQKKKSSFFVYSFPHLNYSNKRRRKKPTLCVYSYLFLDPPSPKNKPPFYRWLKIAQLVDIPLLSMV